MCQALTLLFSNLLLHFHKFVALEKDRELKRINKIATEYLTITIMKLDNDIIRAAFSDFLHRCSSSLILMCKIGGNPL